MSQEGKDRLSGTIQMDETFVGVAEEGRPGRSRPRLHSSFGSTDEQRNLEGWSSIGSSRRLSVQAHTRTET